MLAVTNDHGPTLDIHGVSYDICKDKTARIFVDTDAQQTPIVMLRTPSVQTWAELSSQQSSDTQVSNSNMSRFVFDVPVETDYKSFDVIASVKTESGIYSTAQTINITACQGDVIFGATESLISETTGAWTFPLIKMMPINNVTKIKLINDANGRTIAYPSVLYSSLKHNDNTMYKVTAPDGTCVIGPSENCLVTQSTQLLPGHIKTVTIGSQEYKIRYSGPDDRLERFSISSTQPIVGQWKVEHDTQNGEISNISAMNEELLRIRYVQVN